MVNVFDKEHDFGSLINQSKVLWAAPQGWGPRRGHKWVMGHKARCRQVYWPPRLMLLLYDVNPARAVDGDFREAHSSTRNRPLPHLLSNTSIRIPWSLAPRFRRPA